MRGRSWLSIVSGDGAILIFFFFKNSCPWCFVFKNDAVVSTVPQKRLRKIFNVWKSIFGNKKSFIIAQALNSWVTIDLESYQLVWN